MPSRVRTGAGLTDDTIDSAPAPVPLAKRRRPGDLFGAEAAEESDLVTAADAGELLQQVWIRAGLSDASAESAELPKGSTPDLGSVRAMADLGLYRSARRLQADLLRALTRSLRRSLQSDESKRLAGVLKSLPELLRSAGMVPAEFVCRAASASLPPLPTGAGPQPRRARAYTEVCSALQASAHTSQGAFQPPRTQAPAAHDVVPPLGLREVTQRAALPPSNGGYATDGDFEMDLRLVIDGAGLRAARSGNEEEEAAAVRLEEQLVDQMQAHGLASLCNGVSTLPAWPGLSGPLRSGVVAFIDRWRQKCSEAGGEKLFAAAADPRFRRRMRPPLDLNTLHLKAKLGLHFSLFDVAFDLHQVLRACRVAFPDGDSVHEAAERLGPVLDEELHREWPDSFPAPRRPGPPAAP